MFECMRVLAFLKHHILVSSICVTYCTLIIFFLTYLDNHLRHAQSRKPCGDKRENNCGDPLSTMKLMNKFFQLTSFLDHCNHIHRRHHGEAQKKKILHCKQCQVMISSTVAIIFVGPLHCTSTMTNII